MLLHQCIKIRRFEIKFMIRGFQLKLLLINQD